MNVTISNPVFLLGVLLSDIFLDNQKYTKYLFDSVVLFVFACRFASFTHRYYDQRYSVFLLLSHLLC